MHFWDFCSRHTSKLLQVKPGVRTNLSKLFHWRGAMVIDVTAVLAWIKNAEKSGAVQEQSLSSRHKAWALVKSGVLLPRSFFQGILWTTLMTLVSQIPSMAGNSSYIALLQKHAPDKNIKHLPIIWASVQSGVYSTSQVACARAGRDAVSAMHWVGDETDDKAAGCRDCSINFNRSSNWKCRCRRFRCCDAAYLTPRIII